MKKTMKKMVSVMAMAAMIMSLTACGDNKTGAGSTPTEKTDADAKGAATEAETPADTEVQKIAVGIGNILANQFYVNEDGELTGYDVEVLKAVDELLPQYEFEFDQMEFSSLLVSLEAGKIDIADFQLSKTEEREQNYLFPDECYDISSTVLVVRGEDTDVEGFEQMAGRKMAQMPTANFYTMIETYNEEHPDAAIDLQAIDSLPVADALQMVADGRIDGTLCLKSTFNALQESMGLDLRIAGVMQSYDVYWMLQKDATQLKEDIDGALKELKSNGTISELSEKWYGEDVFAN